MKYIRPTIILLTFIFFACNQKKEKIDLKTVQSQPNLTSHKDSNKLKKNQSTRKDTLQYLMEGENEDNIYSRFLTKKFDTINIVFEDNQHFDSLSKNKMYFVEWKNKLMTSGGDEEIKYQQAFIKKITEIKSKPFR